MISPRVSIREFVFYSSVIFAWIIGLSFLLRVLYGAKPTGGWLVVGIMISGVVYGAYLMTRDLFSTVEKSEPGCRTFHKRPRTVPAKSKEAPKKHLRDRRLAARCYRVVLGIDGVTATGNRRKGGWLNRRQSDFQPVTVRFNAV
jgi:hypothetical protein